MKELSAQLLRAENPLVIQAVAAKLHEAIEDYASEKPIVTMTGADWVPEIHDGPKSLPD